MPQKLVDKNDFGLEIYEKFNKKYLYKDGQRISGGYDDMYFDSPQLFTSGKDFNYTYVKTRGFKFSQLYYKNILLLEMPGFEINFLTLNPNQNYVCLQAFNKPRYEVVYSIKDKKEVTPRFSSIYPAPEFPVVKYYKAYIDHKECILKYPENKVIFRPEDETNINSVGTGIFSKENNFFSVDISFSVPREKKYYMLLNDKPLYIGSHKVLADVLGELYGKMNKKSLIRGIFKWKDKR